MRADLAGDARWWLGIPLSGRLGQPTRCTGPDRERGELRLRLWRTGRIVRGHTGPPAHWLGPGTDLPALAGESAASLRARLPDPPDWTRVIARAWRDFPPHRPDGRTRQPGPPADHTRHPPADRTGRSEEELLGWLGPLLDWAGRELRTGLEQLVSPPHRLDARHPLLAPDTDRLLAMVQRVLLLDLHAARLRGRLPGATPEQRFQAFATELVEPGRALDLLARYPVLARELVAHLRTWIRVRLELAHRLVEDADRLREAFGAPAAGLSAVREIRFGAGDTHRGGRSVAVITYDNRISVVYKPRSLAIERHFNALLSWLNERGLTHPLHPPPVLDRGGYGWCRYVAPSPCRDAAELARFYWRQGSYLALFYALRAYDMHAWNLIADGEHPAYIDLEALFHTEPALTVAESEHHEVTTRVLRNSVLTVQLLPRRLAEPGGGGDPNFGICGLLGGVDEGDQATYPGQSYADAGTDLMRITRRPRPADVSHNRPRLTGAPTPPPIRADAVLAGFEATYRLLLRERPALLDSAGPLAAFHDAEVRVVLRNTRFYAAMVDSSWHPDLLRDSFDRELFLQRLATGHEHYPARASVISSEVRQLDRHDVPVFHAYPGETALYDPSGKVADDFLAVSGLAAVRRRLAGFSEADLREQLWLVRASLCTVLPVPRPEPVPSGARSGDVDPELAIAAARGIGDRLLETALRDPADGTVEWISLHRLAPLYWTVGATSLGLGSGVSGIALFLAELSGLTGVGRYRDVAEEIVRGLVGPGQIPPVEQLRGMSVGAYEDLGGLLNLLLRLAQLWHEPALLAEAERLVPAVAQNLGHDRRIDVRDGIAGAALTLARMSRLRPDAGTAATIRDAAGAVDAAVRRYAAAGKPAPAGLGRGSAGWAYASARLADIIGADIAVSRATRALDLRPRPGSGGPAGGGARPHWCDGVVGTGLAVAAMLGMPGMEPCRTRLLAELGRSIELVRSTWFRDDSYLGTGNDSLCHGDLGIVELLRAAAEAYDDRWLRDQAGLLAHSVAERVLAGRPVTAAPAGVWTPGLLAGAAGIGHGLLRTACPEAVPSVLVL
ncbi:type 2 lanthipeptide synthetase LanM [Plantactinospora sp. DSM 117369]